jgi:hypothetical protein
MIARVERVVHSLNNSSKDEQNRAAIELLNVLSILWFW